MIYSLEEKISLKTLCKNLSFFCPNDDAQIHAIAPIEYATEGILSFSRDSDISNRSGIIFVPASEPSNEKNDLVALLSDNPRKDFIKALDWIDRNIGFKSIEESPKISPSAKIGQNVSIENNVVVEDNVLIESNVTIHKNTTIRSHARIRAGARIGGDGFGFERFEYGVPVRFVHLGGVEIGKNVEIGSNACICRGTFSNTIIAQHAKIDNLVHIAHNVLIGEGSYVIAGASIAGSCKIGKRVWIGPNASVINGLTICDDATIGMGAVVIADVPEGVTIAAIPGRRFPKTDKQ